MQLRLAASIEYKIGWAEFGRGNIASAIEKYLESKRLFEEAHAKRDLIYILAGSLLPLTCSASARLCSEKTFEVL